MNQEDYDKVVDAFTDVIDGCDQYDIQCFTGLPLERCEEIHQLFCELVSKTEETWNVKY